MNIGKIGAHNYWGNPFAAGINGANANGAAATGTGANGAAAAGVQGIGAANHAEAAAGVKNPGASEVKKPGKTVSPAECETCASRKYQDGSDENVSFKAPTHISPEAAGAAVRAHEGEHVANAYSKAAKNDGKVISANVSIKMAVCPECGRNYVAGGLTTTKIKYGDESNPYQKSKKNADAAGVVGMNMDLAV